MWDEDKTKVELIEEVKALRLQLMSFQKSADDSSLQIDIQGNLTELKKRNKELTILNAIISAVNQSPELNQVMNMALAEIDATLGLHYSEIWLYDEFFSRLKSAAQYGLPSTFAREITIFKVGVGLPGVVAQLSQPLFIADLAQDNRFQQKGIITQYNFRSALGIPLMAQENLVGVMVLFSSSAEDFPLEIRTLLTTIGYLIGTAIQSARLFESAQQHLAEQSALLAATRAISSSLDLPTVLESLAEKMAKTLDVTSVQICDWWPDRGTSTVLAEYFALTISPHRKQLSEVGATYHPLDEFDQFGEWLQLGQMMLIHADDPDLTPAEKEHLRRHHGKTLLFMPFVVKGKVTGCVQLWESRQRRNFTLDELALCQGIAQQGAIALENARLFGQAQQEIMERKRAEQRLARQAEESVLLNRVRTALARELEIPGLTQAVVKSIADVFNYTAVALYLLRDGLLVLEHQVGYRRAVDKLSDQGIRTEAARTGKPILLKDVNANFIMLDTTEPVRSLIGIPLFNQDAVIGLLEACSPADWTLGESELRVMRMIGEYISIAFERAYLYTEARESEEKYRTLIEQSQDAIYLIHGNRFEIVNRKFQELFGLTDEQIYNPDFVFTNIVAPKSGKVVAEHANKIEGGLGNTPIVSPVYEFTALDKSGNEIEVELSVSYPNYKGGIATQGILRDISERKRAETERTTMQAQIFQNAKLASMGELAAGVAHEINNPIFAIREFADLILEDTPAGDAIYPRLETIIREADRIADIVRNLLEFSRPSTSNFNPVHLSEIWKLVHTLIGQSFQEQNIQLEVDIPTDLPMINARRQQIQQVMLNLVTNARDALKEKFSDTQHHPQKKITIKARSIEASDILAPKNNRGEVADLFVQFTVRDEGMGISPGDRENLFTPFFTTKRHQGGTGLGLSVSHNIIENHGGWIEVNSKLGEFTEFIVTLPSKQSDE